MEKPDREYFHLEQACINTTNRCNSRCTYCFTDHNDTDMTFEIAKDTINFLWEQSNKDTTFWRGDGYDAPHRLFINWFGGEPMVRYEEVIKPAMLWAEEQGYDIGWGISTNCTLLTPERLEFFRHFKTGILFSIDGIEEVQNDQRPLIGGKPSWPLIKDKLAMLANYEYGSVFRSTIAARNVDKMSDGYCLARKYGFRYYYGGMVYEDPLWDEEHFNIFLEQAFAMSAIMYEDIKKYNSCTVVQPLLASCRSILTGPEIHYSERRCGLGTNTCGISPEGLIYGCQEHATRSKENDVFLIGDIYNGIDVEKRDKLLDAYLDGLYKNDSNPKCENCRFKEDCYVTNCPSVTLRTGGEFGAVFESFCKWREIWDICATLILQIASIENDPNFLKLLEKELLEDEIR